MGTSDTICRRMASVTRKRTFSTVSSKESRCSLSHQFPVPAQAQLAVGKISAAPRFQLGDCREYAASRQPPRPQKNQLGSTVFVQLRPDSGVCQNRLDLRGKQQSAIVFLIKQGLYPDPVAGKKQPPPSLFPYGESKNPVQLFHTLRPKLGIGMEQHLRVGMPRKLCPRTDSSPRSCSVLYNLPVVYQRATPPLPRRGSWADGRPPGQ